METFEICQFAESVLRTMVLEINKETYIPNGGILQIYFSREEIKNAYAQNISTESSPFNHKITITYELICSLYENAVIFHNYLESEFDKKHFDFYFKEDVNYNDLIPEKWNQEQFCKNLFLAALTWIFFHELAHLNQNHFKLVTRTYKLNDLSTRNNIIFDEIIFLIKFDNGQSTFTDNHVFEFFADYEATIICISELIRHFYDDSKELENMIYIFTCGVSLALYSFQNKDYFEISLEDSFTYSHPLPLVRLGMVIPILNEFFSLIAKASYEIEGKKLLNLDRKEIVQLTNRAWVVNSLFWWRIANVPSEFLKNFQIIGLLSDEDFKQYLKLIVKKSDEFREKIIEQQLIRNQFTVMTFTDQVRNLVL